MTVFIALCFAIGVLLIAAAIWIFVRAGARETEEAVLGRLQSDTGLEGDQAAQLREPDLPLLGGIQQLMRRGGLKGSGSTVVLGIVALALIGLLLGLTVGMIGAVGVVVLIALVAYVVLWRMANRRRAKIVEQLPDFLESTTRILSAGNTLEEAFWTAANDSPEPLRGLFVGLSRQIRLGAPMDMVLGDAAETHKLRDVAVIALAVAINRRYGGSIRNVLRSLIATIRQRGTAARELRALTAETRFSAMILSVVSLGLLVYIYLRNPHYYDSMLADSSTKLLLFGAIAWLFVGVVVLWRMVNAVGGDE